MGGIPIISSFAHKKYPSEIRKEAAAFVRQMYQTSTLTLQMFIGCGGINVLVEFLEEDIDTERDLVLIGVNGVWSVFELQVRIHYAVLDKANTLKGTNSQKRFLSNIFSQLCSISTFSCLESCFRRKG